MPPEPSRRAPSAHTPAQATPPPSASPPAPARGFLAGRTPVGGSHTPSQEDVETRLAREQAIAESWLNDSMRAELLGIGNRSRGYQVMHERQAGHLSRMHDIVSTMVIVLQAFSTLIGTGSFVSSMSTDDQSWVGSMVAVVVITFTFATSLTVALQNRGKFEAKSHAHRVMAADWTGFVAHLQKQFIFRDQNLRDLLRASMDRYAELFSKTSDKLPRSVVERYRRETATTTSLEEQFASPGEGELTEAAHRARLAVHARAPTPPPSELRLIIPPSEGEDIEIRRWNHNTSRKKPDDGFAFDLPNKA